MQWGFVELRLSQCGCWRAHQAVLADAGFGTTSGGAFGTSAFGSANNTGSLFGSTQTKPGAAGGEGGGKGEPPKQGILSRINSLFLSAGGLFGSTTFNQPATSSTSTGFGFGTSTGTSNSLFGTTSTGGSLFSSQNNAFAQNKPAGFGSECSWHPSALVGQQWELGVPGGGTGSR